MNKLILYTLLLLVLGLIQSQIRSVNLILDVCLALLILGRSREAVIFAFIGGLILDLLGSLLFGIFACTFSAIVFVVLLINRFLGRPWLLMVLLTGLALVLYYFLISFPAFELPSDLSALLVKNLVVIAMLIPVISWSVNEVSKSNSIRRNR